jgi:hypothetical protein
MSCCTDAHAGKAACVGLRFVLHADTNMQQAYSNGDTRSL